MGEPHPNMIDSKSTILVSLTISRQPHCVRKNPNGILKVVNLLFLNILINRFKLNKDILKNILKMILIL